MLGEEPQALHLASASERLRHAQRSSRESRRDIASAVLSFIAAGAVAVNSEGWSWGVVLSSGALGALLGPLILYGWHFARALWNAPADLAAQEYSALAGSYEREVARRETAEREAQRLASEIGTLKRLDVAAGIELECATDKHDVYVRIINKRTTRQAFHIQVIEIAGGDAAPVLPFLLRWRDEEDEWCEIGPQSAHLAYLACCNGDGDAEDYPLAVVGQPQMTALIARQRQWRPFRVRFMRPRAGEEEVFVNIGGRGHYNSLASQRYNPKWGLRIRLRLQSKDGTADAQRVLLLRFSQGRDAWGADDLPVVDFRPAE